MTGTSTLYDILDVAPDAAQGVIEAAYRALIKKYHPDRIAAGAGGDEKRAAEINQAYTVLRDPARRALYDSEMRKRSEAALKPVVYRPVPPPPRSRFGIKAFLAVLLLVAAAVYAATGLSVPQPAAPQAAEIEQGSQPDPARLARPQTTEVRIRPAVNREDVVRAVATFNRIEPSGMRAAVDYSVACFRRQQDSQRQEDFDFCVAFDEAASAFESLSMDPERTSTSRFAPHVLSVRHVNAARLLGDDHGWINPRLAEIRGMTNVALAEALDRKAAEAPLRTADAVPAAAPIVIPAQRRAEPMPRPVRERRVSAPKRRPAEGDFLEREGYIY
jgi:curved DNA-binding protein CbpA